MTKYKHMTKSDKILLAIGFLILGIFVISIIVPIVYVIVASFMDPTILQNKGISFHFKDWTLTGYQRVLENKMIWIGFRNSILYSLGFTFISVSITILAELILCLKKNLLEEKFSMLFL